MDDNETTKAAKVFLGMLETGAFTQDEYIKKHLSIILKSWLMGSNSITEEDIPSEEIYDSFTQGQFDAWQIIEHRRVIPFAELSDGEYRSDHAIEKTLKQLRDKLDRSKNDFMISRAKSAVFWLVRNGKKMY